MKIKDIKPYPKNAKKHPKKHIEAVANSIKEFGMNQPIVVDKQGVIIVGHGRYEASKLLGIEPEIKVVDLNEEQAKAYRLADNKLNESEWDMGLAIEELKGLSDEMFDLTGFEKDLIIEADEKDDEVPETPEEPKSKLGDLYELGSHRVLCGDSRDESAINRLTKGELCEMVFTSPPYNAGKSESLSGNTHTTDNKYGEYDDNKSQIEWSDLVKGSLSAVIPYSQYQFYNIQMLAGNKKEFLKLLGDYAEQIVDIAIWNKGHGAPAMAKNVMNSAFEFIIIFSSESNPNRSIKISNFRGTFKNILEIPPQRSNEFSNVHAATFPVALPLEIIKGLTYPNAKIIDNFAGTGSTLIACEKTGRKCFGIELDPKYVDVIVQRYVDYTGNEEVKKNGEIIQWEKTDQKPKKEIKG